VARNGKEAHVTATPAHVEFDQGRLPHRLGGGGSLRLVTLAAASACLAFFSPSSSSPIGSAARSPAPATVVPAVELLVSPQYQAKTADTEDKAGPAADPSGGDVAAVAAGSGPRGRWTQLAGAVAGAEPLALRRVVAGPALSAPHARPVPQAEEWYRKQITRYQLHQTSRISITRLRSPIPSSFLDQTLGSKFNQIIKQIDGGETQAHGAKVISSPVRPTEGLADARLLLGLGLALGLAYLAFLVVWFWLTRNRTHGVARVVRF